MAGNDWINSYLEAILDVGPGLDDKNSSLMLRERGKFSPTRYFVEEVITKFDETDLRRSWAMASSIRDSEERNTRLENMSWRIWNLARRKKKLGRKMKQKSVIARVPKPLLADMPEELSEGERGDTVSEISPKGGVSTKGGMKRINSMDVLKNFATQQKEKKLYIVLISLHGLIRGENMELGRDSDTGGQVKYVVELARALGAMPGVYRVDLLTRQVSAPGVDWSYGEPTEMLNPLNDDDCETGESSGTYIIRIPFGPKDKYIPKELLWPHIPEFVDGALTYILQMSKVLSEQIGDGKPVWPASIHGHYADAGNAAALLSGALNVPMLFTGHSLGRDKLEQILQQGRQSKDDINTTYRIMRRIEAEEITVDSSEVIITSTRQEIDEQWNLYDAFDPVLERKLRARNRRNVSCFGRFSPRPIVIPPGMEFKHIVPNSGGADDDSEGYQDNSATPNPPVWSEITRFFTNPHKPIILALARPDPKKNLTTLVKAFGECRALRDLANLLLIMGNRDNIDEMSTTNSAVLLSILKLIDKYDMYGQVSYPKHHKQSEVPEIYRLVARTKGVFINPAFIEPFGLTLIEAAAYGLPMVATKNGGPVDIKKALDNGLLIDPHNQQSIADALLKLVADKQLWSKCKQNGLKNIHLFSWPEHCKTYLARLACCRPRHPHWESCAVGYEYSESQSPEDSLRDLNDLKISLEGVINDHGGVDCSQKSDTNSQSLKSKTSVGKKLENLTKLPVKEETELLELRRKKAVFVVAVDCGLTKHFVDIINMIVEIVRVDKKGENLGLILSTASSISEIHSFMKASKIGLSEFDAVICNSGGDIFYPSNEGSPKSLPFVADSDYLSHIDYRWGGDHLKNTLVHWAASISERKKDKELVVECDSASRHCFSFKIKNLESIPHVKDLREFLRKQALRCRSVYCQNGTKLNVIPVAASRAQALRYLYVRWGMSLVNTVVIMGDYGDTDYESLRGGIHKTVVINGVCNEARKLHSNRSYPLEHVITYDTPNVVQVEECKKDQVIKAMAKLQV
ncbi:putative sucrose-phosphate synthase 1 [Bidens hawaiensis]|uniref:putative sucrose-phosphate synthase 1 n=1 Tax=Bidens hawaiensis TaxID=980011 RepID=UPI00404A56C3